MKTVMKLSLIAATVVVFAGSAALADDSQTRFQWHFNPKVQPSYVPVQKTTTVAVYSQRSGLGQSTMQQGRTELRYEMRWNANGQRFGVFVPDNR